MLRSLGPFEMTKIDFFSGTLENSKIGFFLRSYIRSKSL